MHSTIAHITIAHRASKAVVVTIHLSGLMLGETIPTDPRRTTRTANRSAAVSPSAAPRTRPRLMVVGPMVGANPGHVTTQGEILAALLQAAGYDVCSVSTASNRYVRLADIVITLLRSGRRNDLILLQTYSGPSFVVEDIASALGRMLGCTVVLHLHGGGLPRFFQRFPRWSRRVLARARAIQLPRRCGAPVRLPCSRDSQRHHSG